MALVNSVIAFRIVGDFSNVSKALTAANRQMPRDIQVSINEVARGLRDAARVAALSEPAFGKKHTGLRREVSQGVGIVQLPGGVRITTSMPLEDMAIIPRGMDTVRGWRHPVFGHRDRWVQQTSGDTSWFMDNMQKGYEPLRERLIRNINENIQMIADAGRL